MIVRLGEFGDLSGYRVVYVRIEARQMQAFVLNELLYATVELPRLM